MFFGKSKALSRVSILATGAVLLFSGVAFPAPYWRKVNVNHPGQICGVAMSPSGRHIVINGDFALHSSDRGVTWEMTSGFVPFIMDYGDEKHVFGVGTGQSGFVGVNRSSDYGKTWELIELPQNLINFGEVDFIDSIHGWAVGNKDFIVVTNDGWQTWTTKPYGLAGFTGSGVSFLDTLQGFVAGWLIPTDSTVLRTTDGGNFWTALPLGVSASVSGFSAYFTDSLHGWFFAFYGDDQHIFTSSDAGQSWVEHPTPPHQFLWQIEALDSLRCWIIGDYFGPKVWKTTNGGQSWITEYNGPGDFLLDLDMADTAHGIAVGSSGTVLIYAPFVLGDLSKDGLITAADVVLELNKVFLGQSFPAPAEAGDVNCDGNLTASDVILILNRAFLAVPFPCDPG